MQADDHVLETLRPPRNSPFDVSKLEQPKIRRVKLENSGKTFGVFTNIEFIGVKPKSREAMYICTCECGNTSVVSHGHLSTGHTISCGCKMTRIKHGMSSKPEYDAWVSVKDRCRNQSCKAFKNYGGKGIDISDDFYNDFVAFFNEVGKRPGKGYSLDRIDNTKGYIAGNMRWATSSQQSCNKGMFSNNKTGVKGVHRTVQRGVDYFVAAIEYAGSKRNKYFNIEKLGLEKALQMASNFRDMQELETNLVGADFKQYDEHKRGLL